MSRDRVKRVLYNIPPQKEKKKKKKKKNERCAPDNQYSPPVVNSLILFPIRVTREKFNCAFGNTVNLLTYINHFKTDLKQTLLITQAQLGGCCLREIRKCIIDCGYDTFILPSISNYSVLQTFVTELGIPCWFRWN